jgi:hypothetical protein
MEQLNVVRAEVFLDFAKNALRTIEALMPEAPSLSQTSALEGLRKYVRTLQKNAE